MGFENFSSGFRALRILRRLAKDTKGVVIIEFAIIAAIVFLLIFACIEYAIMMFQRSAMETAAHQVARHAATGRNYAGFDSNLSRPENLKKELEDKLNKVLLTGGDVAIEYDVYADFNDLQNQNPTKKFGGESEQIVRYRITYTYPLYTPIAALANIAMGPAVLRSTVFAKNEKFK